MVRAKDKLGGNVMDNDTISRQAALYELHLLSIEALKKHRFDYDALITICSKKLKNLPSVQSEQKTGQWMINSDGYYPYCSRCIREPQNRIMTDYCPNCGAYMKKGNSNER